ncbi:MAG: hypothetical protein ABIQ35_15580, partial [Verrucomicrobiota bacterium]
MKLEKSTAAGRGGHVQRAWATLLYLFALLFQAHATNIVYTFSGTGNGQVGTTTFTAASFSISVLADTTNVYPIVEPDFSIFGVNAISSQFRIAGIGSGTFSNANTYFVNQTTRVVGWADAGGDKLDVQHSSLETYNLRTPFASLLIPGPAFAGGFGDEPSTMGPVTITMMRDITFSAAFRPQMNVRTLQATNIQVCWTSQSNRVYQVEYCSAL